MKFLSFLNVLFNFAAIGFVPKYSIDLKMNGKTKNLKHAAVEIGLPGKPKNTVFVFNFENKIGLPGLIFEFLNLYLVLNFHLPDFEAI